ncbi:hypothetical protein MUK42_34876 [Musa troglodytarum]|uniref:Uncharacterized protein n=1 Tax=Musa troglodytarum TaxID=320322 RepID=A0A9E7E7V9_9LILI|nr:hypothetical protein MUK42_34876 [Musa troglodytarum]
MARYTDGNDWHECTEFEGILLATTADEKAVIVEVLPAAVEATADEKDVLRAAVEATADEKASAVDVHPAIKITIMETEY